MIRPAENGPLPGYRWDGDLRPGWVDFRRSASERISLEADVAAPHAFDPAPNSSKARCRSWTALDMGHTALFIKSLIVVQVTRTQSGQISDLVTSSLDGVLLIWE